MSCNGCRVLRKGCSETCILRPCLQWIDSPESQGHATVFVAKFFGRAGLTSFISNVPDSQRPALFQSLLFEACGRTVNPVNGAVGLLGTGNWHLCQTAVETVLRGGTLRPLPDLVMNNRFEDESSELADEEAATCSNLWTVPIKSSKPVKKAAGRSSEDLDLSLSPGYGGGRSEKNKRQRRPGTPSEESGTSFEQVQQQGHAGQAQDCHFQRRSEAKLLTLFR